MERTTHPFMPVYDKNSKILILGSFPSVKSREGEFYYHHPRNRFWKVISLICNEVLPVSIDEKKQMLLRNGIAVWDVIKSCEITGSSDSSIRNVIPNDITFLLENTAVGKIFANGETAFRLYMRYIYKVTGQEITKLASTSPANAAFTLDRLVENWSSIKDFIK